MNASLEKIDHIIISQARRWYIPLARTSFFIIFFYFGLLKLLGLSPATPLAVALTEQTVGGSYFIVAYTFLAGIECLIGVLFLIPKATRIVIPLLFIHMAVVCSPLVLIPQEVWYAPFVPSLEGQYIIKNLALIAIAIGIAAHLTPLKVTRKKSQRR